ncbi:MAG: hypothetical protein J6A47_09090 [Bacilli bacterium]|nr:hypothetical protein [Bacilli bacterium]
MKKSTIKSPLKILAATSVTIFSLLSVFTSTAAWFDSQRNLKNGANEMAISSYNDLESFAIYRPVENGATVSTYHFKSTADAVVHINEDMSTSINMGENANPYSSLEPFHPLLFVATYKTVLDTSLGAVKVKAVDADPYIASIPGYDSSHDITGNEEGSYPLSSIVEFKAKAFESATAFEAAFPNMTIQTSALSSWSSSSFVEVDEDAVTPNDECQILKETSGNVKIIAFVMEYNVASINFISSYYLGEPFMNENLAFACDWRLEL